MSALIRTLQRMSDEGDEIAYDALEEITRLTTQITAFKAGWMRVIDTEMVITHTGIAEFDDDYITAKTKLLRLIDWYVGVRTDPVMNGGRQLVPTEPLYKLLDYAEESDSACYGTLSTSLVVELIKETLAAAPKPEDV